jgi:hypothetical protein
LASAASGGTVATAASTAGGGALPDSFGGSPAIGSSGFCSCFMITTVVIAAAATTRTPAITKPALPRRGWTSPAALPSVVGTGVTYMPGGGVGVCEYWIWLGCCGNGVVIGDVIGPGV